MNSSACDDAAGTVDALAMDELSHWELRVAKRADELAPKTPRGRDDDLRYWLQAENEVLPLACVECTPVADLKSPRVSPARAEG